MKNSLKIFILFGITFPLLVSLKTNLDLINIVRIHVDEDYRNKVRYKVWERRLSELKNNKLENEF